MNLKYLLSTGRVPAVHPAAMYLFGAFLLMSLLLKKAFCSWLCPVGCVQSGLSPRLWARWAQRALKPFGRRNLRRPKAMDISLRGLKYVLLGFFVAIVGAMSAEELAGFVESLMESPYGLIADVEMLNFFRGMSLPTAIILALQVPLSIFIHNIWCRYPCPYGALLGLAWLLSPVKIRRDTSARVDCAKCATPVPRSCRSTSWCRFDLSSAAPAWFAMPPARRGTRSSLPCRRASPKCRIRAGIAARSAPRPWPACSPASSLVSCSMHGLQTTGAPICPIVCTSIWFRA